MARTIVNNSFYLHLDSSVDDRDIFVENNLGDFSQYLPDAINLSCEDNEHWEIALEQLVLPNALNNIYPGQNEFEYSLIIKEYMPPQQPVPQTKVSLVFEGATNPYKITVPFSLEAGYYDTLSFTSAINNKMEKIKDYLFKHFKNYGLAQGDTHFHLHYSSISRKLYFHSNPFLLEQITVRNNKLQKMLGLRTKSFPNYPKLKSILDFPDPNKVEIGSFPGPLQPNLNRHFQKIIVYCDIAQKSIVNDKYVPVIRVFDISTLLNSNTQTVSSKTPSKEEQEGDKMPLTCINPHIQRLHFFPVNTNIIQEISLKLANEFGEDLIFCETKDVTHVVLFFKKIQNAAFNSV